MVKEPVWEWWVRLEPEGELGRGCAVSTSTWSWFSASAGAKALSGSCFYLEALCQWPQVPFWLAWKMQVYIMIYVGLAGGVIFLRCKNFSVAIFLDTTNVINVKLCMMVLAYWSLPIHTIFSDPCSGELRTQKLKSHLLRIQSLKVLPLNPGVGQHIAIHGTLTARDFFLANFYPSSSFTCIFSEISPKFFLHWLWLTLVLVGPGE